MSNLFQTCSNLVRLQVTRLVKLTHKLVFVEARIRCPSFQRTRPPGDEVFEHRPEITALVDEVRLSVIVVSVGLLLVWLWHL